jgi:hypothetical protein
MEALFVSLLDKAVSAITPDDYNNLLDRLNYSPRIEYLDKQRIEEAR